MIHTNSSFLSALAAALVLATGCAQEQPPIDRVQTDYFDKSFFVGQDYLSASDDPEFYSQATLVDVGFGAGQMGLFTSTYAQPLTRVRWTVTEDLLIARLAYEHVESSDGKGAGRATNDGIVVAAYRIAKHFDIQRTYNPSTGEQLNVIEENSVDRRWFERQYIRVDWSKNLSTDNYAFDTLSQLGIYSGVSYEPLAYFVQDPDSEDAPHFDPANGYLDVTNKAFAKPSLIDLSNLGSSGVLPACMLGADIHASGSAPSTSCSPVELTIRQSFRQVTENDYEPAHWDGYRFQAFGAFVTERSGYARNYGMTDTQWYRFINRYNLWERSHAYSDPAAMKGETACYTPSTTPAGADPQRDLDGNGTHDECESVGRGSRCDTFTQKCTLPYRDRRVLTIPWYYANGSHPEFFEATYEATHEWDVALRSSVMAARYAECKATGEASCAAAFPIYNGQQDENHDAIQLAREVDDCRNGRAHAGQDCLALADQLGAARGYSAGVIALAKLEEVLVLCHSPVEANDPAACGAQRLPAGMTATQCEEALTVTGDKAVLATCRKAINVRRGDLRYHQVNAIRTPQTPSPWGIMVDANDPLTGETISASINVWTHVNDLWSQGVVDMARYIKGELATSDVTEGTYIRDWAMAAEAATSGGSLPRLTREQLNQSLADFSGGDAEALERLDLGETQLPPELMKTLRQVSREAAATIRFDAFAPSANKPIYEARRKRAIGSRTEAELTTKMMQSLSGGGGWLDTSAQLHLASPLRGANPTYQRELMHRHELALAKQGACMMNEAPAPFALANLADLLAEKFGAFNAGEDKSKQLARAEKMQKYLAQKAHYAVTTHEMGHSIGLRHNFVSSSDAWNYRPQYWQLRTDNGANGTLCTTLTPDGSCVGPRWQDPVTPNEQRNLITMFMQSSTMDYAGEAAQDLLGLGAYDFAAARMFYGDVASVFADDGFKVGFPRSVGVLEKLDNFGGILGFKPSIGTGGTNTRNIHYSALQKEYDLIWGCRDVNPTDFKPAVWDTEEMGEWHPLLDGLFVQVGGKTSRCRQQPVDYVSWGQLRNATSTEVGFTRSGRAVDPEGRVRFPYGFATDRWADLGNLSVYRHDNGADPYELFDFLITQQEVNHIFDNYRRNRQTFSVRGAANRSLSRYSEKLRDAAKGLGLMANIHRDYWLAHPDLKGNFDSLWPYVGKLSFPENILASQLAFDHFAKQLARPQAGPHFWGPSGPGNTGSVLRSALDAPYAGGTVLVVPNGATGYFGNVSPGGRPLENGLSESHGEYDAEYTINAGSYYDKAYTAMLMTESVDNFISDSRRDFLDARYRSVSMADLFPDAYRRWLSNNLTGDHVLKGLRVASSPSGGPQVGEGQYPSRGLGFTSWWKAAPEACFQEQSSITCSASPSNSVPLDSQIGWEQQKFLIAWTLMYLPENEQQAWLNQMNIWELGADNDPGFENRIELHLPNGRVFVAKTFGKETLYSKSVQKGIAARMLEWGNELLKAAYVTTNGPDLDGDGVPDWFEPTFQAGKPAVKYDPSVQWFNEAGNLSTRPGCNTTENYACTCNSNRACLELSSYEQLPFFMRQAMRDFGMADPSMRGIY